MLNLRIFTFLTPFLAMSQKALALPALSTEGNVLHARTDIDTECEVGDSRVGASDDSGNEPAAFTELWDAVENDLCTELGCKYDKQKCVTMDSVGDQVCIQARGSFTREQRNDFIKSARGIFDRTVIRGIPSSPGEPYIESGTNLVDLVSKSGDYSGYHLRVELHMQNPPKDQCPATIKDIAAAGSALPEVGSLFGLVGFFCSNPADSDPMLSLKASG